MSRTTFRSLGFPVAIRKNLQDDSKWNSIFAEEDINIETYDYTVLQAPGRRDELGGFITKILLLPSTESWHMFLTLTVIFNYILGMSCFFFLPQRLLTYMNFYVVFDLIYLFNLVINLIHHFSKKIQQKFQLKPKARLLLILDVISLLPQEWIVGLCLGFSHRYVYYCRLVTFIRLYRVTLLFEEILGSVRQKRWTWFLIQYVILFSMLLHTAVCIWFNMGCKAECDKGNFWTAILDVGTLTVQNVAQWYLVCLYISLSLMSNTGFGDFYATRLDEGVYCIIVMMSGFLLVAILIAVLTVQLVNVGYRRFKFSYELLNIKEVLRQIDASPELTQQVLSYYKVLWTNKNGVNEAPDLYNLPNPLRMEIMYDINIAHLQNSLLLRNQPEALLRKISLLIQHRFLLPGDVLFYQGVVKGKIVFIASGVLEILSEEDDQSPIISFKAGTVLGEVSLLLTVPAKATVHAATYTELQIIERQDFMRMMLDHPDTTVELRKIINKRLQVAREERISRVKDHVIMNLLVSNAQQVCPIKLLKDRLSTLQKNAQPQEAQSTSFTDDFTEDEVGVGTSQEKQHISESCLPLYRLTENVTMIESPRVCLVQTFPWILDPHSTLVYYWNIVVDMIQIFLCVIFPYYILYYRIIPSHIILYGFVADAFYFIDIYILCTTAVVLRNRTIKKFRNILNYRMQSTTFYVDVFSLFPIEILAYATYLPRDERRRLFSLLKLNRILRVWRLHKFFKGLESDMSRNILILRFLKYSIYLGLAAFWSGAILYVDSCMYPVCTENSWFYIQMKQGITLRRLLPCFKYPVALSTYFGVNTLLLVGYGDVLPNSDVDIIVVSVLMLLGIFMICYGTAQLCATFSLAERFRRDFQENVIALGRFLEKNNLMHSLYERVIIFFRLQWSYDKGTGRDFLLNSAPPHLRSKLQTTELKAALSKIPLFQMVDVDFLLMIVEGARVQVLPSDEIIAYMGDMSREMYILLNGHCQVLSDSGAVLNCYGPGSQFGVLEMIYGIPKRYTTRTVTNCKVISVDYRTYIQAMSMFPTICQEAKKVMEENDLLEWVHDVDLERLRVRVDKTDTAKRKMVYQIISYFSYTRRFFNQSFILTIRKCKKSNGHDDYWAPFKTMGKFQYMGYLLLPITIHPSGPFIKLWCFIRILVIMTVCFFAPFYIAVAPYAAKFHWIMISTDVCAYIDIYLLMHLAYYNKNGILVTHPKHTALHYIKHSFLLDLLAIFPMMLIVHWEDPSHNEGHDPIGHIISPHLHHCTWHLNTLIQFHRIPELFHYMEADILKNIYNIRFFKFIPLTMVLINLAASLIFGLNCNYIFYKERLYDDASEIPVYVPAIKTTYYGYLKCMNGSWISQSGFQNSTDPIEVYLIAVYWVTSTLLSVGVGDITAHSISSIYIVIFTVIMGRLLFACVFANLATGRAQFSTVMSEYQENLKDMMAFLKYENVDYHWQKKLFKYFEYVWKRTSGVRAQELCQKLNTALMEDTVVFLYEKTLREVPLFENVEKSFIRVIAKHLSEQYFRKGDTVMRSFDVQNNIYIIYRGKVEVLSSYNEMIACMGPGGLFGNIRQVNAGCSSISIVASRNLDVLVISSETFYTVIKDYPRIKRNMDTLLETVTDYIMPTTIIDDGSYDYSNDVTAGSSVSEITQESGMAANMAELKQANTNLRTSVSIGTSHATYQSEKQKFAAVKMALNIFLPHKWFRFAIFPDNIVIRFVDIAVLLVSYLDILTITYNFVTQSNSMVWLIVNLALETVFYLRILLSFHVAYMDEYGNYITQCKKIAGHYFNNRMSLFWNIISNLPVEAAYFFIPKKKRLFIISTLRLVHLLRIQYILDYFREVNKMLMTYLAFNQVLKVAMFMSITLHILACAWLMIACPFNECLPDTWVTKFDFLHHRPFHRYFVAIYYVVSLGTTTGIGDIYPYTIPEVAFSIMAMVVCRFLTALIIGDLVTVINISSRSLVNYEYRIYTLQDFLRNQNLSGHQMEKLWVYLRSLWTQQKGQHIPTILQFCPYVLRCDIMTVMFGHHLRNSFLFQGISEALLRQLAVRLNRIVFFQGNYIVQHGDIDQNMYFVHNGEVSVLTVHSNLTETQHELLKNQDMFGLAQGLFHGLPHHFSFRANTRVSILVLNLDSWYHILKYFPADKELIYDRARTIYIKV